MDFRYDPVSLSQPVGPHPIGLLSSSASATSGDSQRTAFRSSTASPGVPIGVGPSGLLQIATGDPAAVAF
jgi:hypothetical protein